MNGVSMISAYRTAVVPRNGALSRVEAWDLAAPVFVELLQDTGIHVDQINAVIMGNALYGGGNPARMAALKAGLPDSLTCQTIDTQCCSGMDAIANAVYRIKSGQDQIVIAGGLESWSRSPIRARRSEHSGELPEPYLRPPFAPWKERDPDLADSAASLAYDRNITREDQERYAIESHRRAIESKGRLRDEIVTIDGVGIDSFSRHLTTRLCQRLPCITGDETFGLTSSTIAVEADAAAAVLLVSDSVIETLGNLKKAVRIVGVTSCGGKPEMPALAPVDASRSLLERCKLNAKDINVSEVMEAYAVQAISCINDIGLNPLECNVGGGALARGHAVAASGAVNTVRLFHELTRLPRGAYGLATIAAAGGLGSALIGQNR